MAVPQDVAAIITRKKARYGRFLDTGMWNRFGEIALPDATFDFINPDGAPQVVGKTVMSFTSSKSFTTFLSKLFQKADTLHMFGPGELTQTAPDEVEAIWSMEDQILMAGGLVEIRGGGYYHEVWKQEKGDWFLQSLRLQRTYSKTPLLTKILIGLATLLRLNIP